MQKHPRKSAFRGVTAGRGQMGQGSKLNLQTLKSGLNLKAALLGILARFAVMVLLVFPPEFALGVLIGSKRITEEEGNAFDNSLMGHIVTLFSESLIPMICAGYIAGRIAKQAEVKNAVLVRVIIVLYLGVSFDLFPTDGDHHLYRTMTAITIPMAAWGGYIARSRNSKGRRLSK